MHRLSLTRGPTNATPKSSAPSLVDRLSSSPTIAGRFAPKTIPTIPFSRGGDGGGTSYARSTFIKKTLETSSKDVLKMSHTQRRRLPPIYHRKRENDENWPQRRARTRPQIASHRSLENRSKRLEAPFFRRTRTSRRDGGEGIGSSAPNSERKKTTKTRVFHRHQSFETTVADVFSTIEKRLENEGVNGHGNC